MSEKLHLYVPDKKRHDAENIRVMRVLFFELSLLNILSNQIRMDQQTLTTDFPLVLQARTGFPQLSKTNHRYFINKLQQAKAKNYC